jgi:SAM-dependent methyltransferase
MNEAKELVRENARKIAAKYAEKGDATGWFEELYKEAAGNHEHISWADLEPNRFLVEWAEKTGLKGNGRKALVVGCGLGDDARYLYDLGFEVTAFDISPTAIEWAKKLHADTNIQFESADLFEPNTAWRNAFEFVLEVYTIQPLPLEMRPRVIDAIAAFVAPHGELVVVARGREDDDQSEQLPWPVSRRDLSRFENSGLVQQQFHVIAGDEEDPEQRFVAVYKKTA